MINRTLFLYWGRNQPLSWLRLQTVVTFKKLNTEWNIKVYTPKNINTNITWGTGENSSYYQGKDYFNEVSKYAEVVEIDTDSNLTEVHKSDILRNKLLVEYGGIWSDFDIVYIKPIPDSLLEKDFICNYGGDYSIGFLGAHKDSELFKFFIQMQKDVNSLGYQSFGNELYHRVKLSELENKFDFYNIPMNLVYFYDSTHIANIFGDYEITKDSIGVHWYAGCKDTRKWEEDLNSTTVKWFNNLICRKLIEVLEL